MARTALHTLFALSAMTVGSVHAFWEYGHIFVARVAYEQLQFSREGRDVLSKANDLL
jgi:hypothetical protein